MAGRIRTLKPELLDLECAAALSSDAWRLWISMMLLADDHGNLRAAPRLLAANVYQDTGKADLVEASIAELTAMPEACRVWLYRVGAEVFAHLNGFADNGCSAIQQYLKKLGHNRVPPHTDPRAEPVSVIPRSSAPIRRKLRRTAADAGEPQRTQASAGSRAHAPIPIPIPIPISDLRSRSPISDPEVVAAPDPGYRVREPEPPTDGDDRKADHDPERDGPPTAPSAANPQPPIRPAQALPMPAPTARPRRPRYEAQWVVLNEVPLPDPETGDQLYLNLADLTPEEAAAKREEALRIYVAKTEQRLQAERQAPAQPVAAPHPPEDRPAQSPRRAPAPTPPALPNGGDVVGFVREQLAAAAAPIRYLVGRSEERLAAGLIGGQLRPSDVAPALMLAAMKLDRRFAALTADSPEQELESLHRFVAGFLAAEPQRRRSQRQPLAVPEAQEVTEAGEKLLARYLAAYRDRFARDYEPAEDDPQHATAIAAELGRRLDRERDATPGLDERRARRALVQQLLGAWFGDNFAERCGHALRHLARLLREEPNRFRLDATGELGRGAADMPPEHLPAPRPRPISAADRAAVEQVIDQIGAGGVAL